MRTRHLLLPLAILSGGCSGPREDTEVEALRFRFASSGRYEYVLFLPTLGVYCEVLWCIVRPLSAGSNAQCPSAFADHGTVEDTLDHLLFERGIQARPRPEVIPIPTELAHEIVRLADDRANEQLASSLFDAGLVPQLWHLTLGGFGTSDHK